MSVTGKIKPITVPWVKRQKGLNPLTALTAYDYPSAQILDQSGVDLLLVGDSLGPVLYGEPNTLSVTLEDILRHTQAVSRAAKRALVIADMPFLSYQISTAQAVENAGRMIKEAKAQAVKLEGGAEMAETVSVLTRVGIPVMGHIGLTPQSIHTMGNYRMHGKTEAERNYLFQSAKELTDAGAFALVLECVEDHLAKEITANISIPTVGIGSGKGCDGQILVTHDLVGLTMGHVPRFVEPLANLGQEMKKAVEAYVERTRSSTESLGLTVKTDSKESEIHKVN